MVDEIKIALFLFQTLVKISPVAVWREPHPTQGGFLEADCMERGQGGQAFRLAFLPASVDRMGLERRHCLVGYCLPCHDPMDIAHPRALTSIGRAISRSIAPPGVGRAVRDWPSLPSNGSQCCTGGPTFPRLRKRRSHLAEQQAASWSAIS